LIKKIIVTDPAADAASLRNSRPGLSDELIQNVAVIMNNVAQQGDAAVADYTKKLDGVMLNSLRVTREEFERAFSIVTKEQIRAINLVKKRLTEGEEALMNQLKGIRIFSDGILMKRFAHAISSVGCYIPGGNARYASTVAMCAVPAKVAGVKRIVAISPPRRDGTIDPLTLVVAKICGINEFYKIGGAQGIAALAFGTQSIKRVCKIVGPGGAFVTGAKYVASRMVSIDMLAGPTELLVYADSESDPKLIAMDLVSQAEHGSDSFCGLVTTSEDLARKTAAQLEFILKGDRIPRGEIVRKCLKQNGFIAVCKNQAAAIEFANEIAPEHLELLCKNARSISKKVESAGLVLIGKYAPPSASDYCFGSNHILPTLGFGKSRSSLSVLDFLKLANIIEATRYGLEKVQHDVREIASAEGLMNHYLAVRERLRK
jgi:histidinol dehydrogenase